MSRPLVFWGSALGAALGFALLSALFLPYESLRLDTEAERWRAWLLTLWTAGVLGVLFGLTGLLSFLSPLGIREVVDAGGVAKAIEGRQRERRRLGESTFHGNFAWWLVVTGALLVGVYFVAWSILRY